MDQGNDLEIIVGTYEDYIVGYQIESVNKKGVQNGTNKKQESTEKCPSVAIEQSFAVRSHNGSVRCLATSPDGRIVFSSGYDETMNLFNLKRRKLLQTSEGAINCATFAGNSHLICGYEDGDIQVYECKGSSMTLAKTLKGHCASVISIDVHPSGKVLLSLSKDNTMRTWNLIKGRCAYVTNLKQEAHLVKWSKTGEEFLIAANNEIYLFNSLGNLKKCIKLDKRINSIEFITENIFGVAIDSCKLELFDIDECRAIIKFDAHEARLKSIKCLDTPRDQPSKCDGHTNDDPSTNTNVRFATASSDGSIKVWSITGRKGTLEGPKELAKVEVGSRVTCMVVSTRTPNR